MKAIKKKPEIKKKRAEGKPVTSPSKPPGQTNEYLESLFTYANAPIIVWDPQLKITHFNKAFESLTGRKAEEVIGKSIEILFQHDRIKGPIELIAKTLQGEQWHFGEIDIGHLDGSVRTVLWNLATIFAVDGDTPVATIVQGHDITERKKAEEALLKSEELFRSLFDNMLNGFAYCKMLFDQERPQDFIYLNVNKAFETLTGLKNVVGKKVSEVIPDIKESDPELLERYGRVALTGIPEVFEVYLQALKMWFSISVYSPEKEYFVAVFDVITERKKADEELIKNEERFRQITENTEELIWEVDADGLYTYVSPVVEKILGYKPEEVVGKKHFFDFFAPDIKEKIKKSASVYFLRKQVIKKTSNKYVHKQGNIVLIETSGVPILDSKGTLLGYRGVDIDITEHRRLENQLRQSQKMEAVGQLAGGIAHDFNNILTAIYGYASAALRNMVQNDPNRLNIEHLHEAAERAAQLTQSLLTFSRKQIINIKPVGLHEIISNVEKFLVRVIGEDIKVRIVFNESEINVLVDSGQIEQVIMNLATNARDAMTKGGRFTIETALTEIDAQFISNHGFGKPGKYAVVSVTDTGIGMDEETRKRIFEPFFTTKGVGKGTGLGLAMVYGIVKQHDGYINVYSEPGNGTTFRIYLPVAGAGVKAISEENSVETVMPHGTETVLLAEDNETVKRLISDVLGEFGYTVIIANDGQDAVEKFTENRERIQLLLFDMIMPNKNGKEAYEEIRKMNPEIRVIFMSGYTADIIKEKDSLGDNLAFITKPMLPVDLLRKVREALDRGK